MVDLMNVEWSNATAYRVAKDQKDQTVPSQVINT